MKDKAWSLLGVMTREYLNLGILDGFLSFQRLNLHISEVGVL